MPVPDMKRAPLPAEVGGSQLTRALSARGGACGRFPVNGGQHTRSSSKRNPQKKNPRTMTVRGLSFECQD